MTEAEHQTLLATLVRWWSDDLPESEALAFEEHLFSCERCTRASEALGPLVTSLREHLPPIISEAHRARLAAAGLRLKTTEVAPNSTASVVFSRGADLLIHELRGDFSRAERVDLEIEGVDGSFRVAHEAIPFDRDAGRVLVACQRHFGEVFATDPHFHLFVHEGGVRRPVASYLVLHTWNDPEPPARV